VLYQRYRDRVYRYARTRTADDEDAADLTQQVFLRAIDALPQYSARRGPFPAWLFGIARNAATDLLRRQRHRQTESDFGLVALPGQFDDPIARVVRSEAIRDVRRLLASLDPAKRELLALRYAAELTIPEIAAVTGKSVAATSKQLSRLLQKLQEQYDAGA
jgi:RNA polymerase sigma-70 factor (ECF subfamily)